MLRGQRQFLAGFIVVALLLVAIGVLNVQQLGQVTTTFSEVTERTSPQLIALGRIEATSQRMIFEATSILLISVAQDESSAAELEDEIAHLSEAKEAFDQSVEEYKLLAEDDEEVELAEQLQAKGDEAYTAGLEGIELVEDQSQLESLLDIRTQLDESNQSLDALIVEAVTIESEELEEEVAAANRSGSTAALLGVISVAIGVLLTGFLSTVMTRQANERAKQEQERLAQLVKLNEALQTARDEALAASRLKSEFLASMSHELRTPLNAILNFNEMVVTEVVGEINEEQKELLTISLSSAQHLLELINDVLDMSKIQSGMLSLFTEDNVSLTDEIQNAVSTTEVLLKNKPIEFIAEIDPDLPAIQGDRRRIRQILLNLLSNAAKFTKQGSVKLMVKRQGDQVLFSISDTGPGIAKEDQQLIFEPFTQTIEGSQQTGGTGLGLPITKWLAEAHGGQIHVESEPGHGSTFRVLLPIGAQEAALEGVAQHA